MKNLKQYIENLYLPGAEQYNKLLTGTYNEKIAEIKNLYRNGMFTERFVLLQGVYRFLLSRFLLGQTELAQIDQEIEKYEIGFSKIESAQRDIYQRNDFIGLRYVYLRNPIHIERLEESQLKFLESLLGSISKEKARKAGELLKNTYKEVLAFSEETMFQETELFPSLYGEGNVFAGALVFVVEVKTTTEVRKLMELKKHVEPMLSISLDMPVNIWVKSHL